MNFFSHPSAAYTHTCLISIGVLSYCLAHAEPAWAPTGIVTNDGSQVLYAPHSARVEIDNNGVKFRAIDSKILTAKRQWGPAESWKVRADTCNHRNVDLIVHQNGQDIGSYRAVSMQTTKNPLTRKAILACNLPLMD